MMIKKLLQALLLTTAISLVGCNVGKSDTSGTDGSSTSLSGNKFQGGYDTGIGVPGDISPSDLAAGMYHAGAASFLVKPDGSVTDITAAEGSVILHGYRMSIGPGSTVDANGKFHLNFNAEGATYVVADGVIDGNGKITNAIVFEGANGARGWMNGQRR